MNIFFFTFLIAGMHFSLLSLVPVCFFFHMFYLVSFFLLIPYHFCNGARHLAHVVLLQVSRS